MNSKKCIFLLIIFFLFEINVSFASVKLNITLIRKEILSLNNDLLASRKVQLGAKQQLQKIKKLLALQKQEIEYSKKKIAELSSDLDEMSSKKQETQEKILAQKNNIRNRLSDLYKVTQYEILDASFLWNRDYEIQKSVFLTRNLKKDIHKTNELKESIVYANKLEEQILEDRENLETMLSDFSKKSSLLSFNEQIQKGLLKNNKASVLEAMNKIKELRTNEEELEKTISAIKKQKQELTSDFSLTKGSLPLPIDAPILSGFGKSYDSKKNLLTYQKGVLFKVNPSSEIHSVGQGVAAFVGPLNNYGQIVILEHPGGYFTLYGQLESSNIKQGSLIKAGEVIGFSSKEPFYFEIRNQELALDPRLWFGKTETVAQITGGTNATHSSINILGRMTHTISAETEHDQKF